MKLFTRLFIELDETNKTAEKVGAIERYFREAPAADAAWGLFFLSGQRLKRIVKTSVVHDACGRATGMPEWMIGECSDAVGDFSETIALLLPERKMDGFDEPLHRVVEKRIIPLLHAEDRSAAGMLMDAWAHLDRREVFVFNKLIRGNFRVGVQRALVVRALAQATGVEAATLTHRMSGTFEPTEAAFLALVSADGDADRSARPYPFCLAHQLDEPTSALGMREWQVEFKWDGIRAQVLRREDDKGGVMIWSRGEELITGQFPEIAAAARQMAPGTVLDGEILAWRFDGDGGGRGGRPLSFNALQTRINRKNSQPSLFDAEGVVFAAFDLVEHEGREIRELPLRERRTLLEAVVAPLERETGGVIRLPALASRGSWEEIEAVRAGAREEHGAEGLMLKHLGSRYHTGRVSGGTAANISKSGVGGAASAGWWKWKVDPFSIDAVLMYAQQGSGRRAGLFTDYTFGVWDGDELTPFAKAYSGLTNEEIKRVDAFIRANTLDKKGPVRLVKPELVFEISFEGIQESTRHRSGVAVRFPRMTRWRTDKKAADADTIVTVRALLRAERERDAARNTGPTSPPDIKKFPPPSPPRD